VFLADDSRLCLKVALKILPENSSEDKERLRRFERERHCNQYVVASDWQLFLSTRRLQRQAHLRLVSCSTRGCEEMTIATGERLGPANTRSYVWARPLFGDRQEYLTGSGF
jgi:hypothetical protein